MRLEVRPLDIDDERDVEASFRIHAAARRVDVPDFPAWSWTDHVGRLRHQWPGASSHTWLAFGDGDPHGLLTVDLPNLDNTHTAVVELIVDPDYRRRGVGTALYTTATDFVRANGRRVLQGTHVTQMPGGPVRSAAHAAFAEAMGTKAALPEIRRRLDLDTVDRAGWTELLADARPRASGYSVVTWTDSAPDEIVADVAELEARLLLDAPMGDLIVEAEKIDVARIRATEEIIRLRGRRTYQVGARHDASGRLAAWTMIALDADTTSHGWQNITIVDPTHRGHRLGLVVKIENLFLTLAHEPDLRHINTWNATENSHMIAINEALGFRAVDAWVSWQHEL